MGSCVKNLHTLRSLELAWHRILIRGGCEEVQVCSTLFNFHACRLKHCYIWSELFNSSSGNLHRIYEKYYKNTIQGAKRKAFVCLSLRWLYSVLSVSLNQWSPTSTNTINKKGEIAPCCKLLCEIVWPNLMPGSKEGGGGCRKFI